MSDREECGAPQPGRSAVCERTDEHTEHRATLTPKKTYCYWTDERRVVNYRPGIANPDACPTCGGDRDVWVSWDHADRETCWQCKGTGLAPVSSDEVNT